jgi:cyclophilin family peptidyl-prolyl cis-trans isomerase
VLSVLRALSPPVTGGNDALARLATLDLDGADGPARRRLIAVRCAASSLLAGTASLSTRLVQCDPDGGRARDLAVLDVLDRGPLVGARGSRHAELARSKDAVVRRRAVELLTTHGETRAAAEILKDALAAESPGVVAAAARVLIARPARARRKDATTTPEEDAPLEPEPAVLEALGTAIDHVLAPDQIEPHGLLLRAAAAVGLLSAKPKAEAACHDENATLREHARAALRAFGQDVKACAPTDRAAPGDALDALPESPRTLTFVTDAGRLGMTLDPELAPLSVARILSLAHNGFYDGMAIHRVVPGFVVQLGDRLGDGYGGTGARPVPSEAAPAAFEALGVGLAQSGPDTGSSQIFVTLATEPLLGGDYPMLGWADPEWYGVAEGDVIRSVEVKE